MRLEQCPTTASAAISVGGYSPWLQDMIIILISYFAALVLCLQEAVLLPGSSCPRYARQAPPVFNLVASRIRMHRLCNIIALANTKDHMRILLASSDFHMAQSVQSIR
jgi:hypothetical protein